MILRQVITKFFSQLIFLTLLACSGPMDKILVDPGITLPEQQEIKKPSQEINDLQEKAAMLFMDLSSNAENKDFSEVFSLLDKAILLNPNVPTVYATKAGFLMNLKRYPEAEAAFSQGIKIRPHFAELYFGRAQAQAQQGKMSEAEQSLRYGIAAFNLRLKDKPDDPGILTNRALLVYLMGNEKLALQELDRVLKDHPRDPTADFLKKSIVANQGKDRWKLEGILQ